MLAPTTVDLMMAAGLATGVVEAATTDTSAYNYATARTIDRSAGFLHVQMSSSGNGSTSSSDTIVVLYVDGADTSARKVSTDQNGRSQASVRAEAHLADAAGHTGNWLLTTAESTVVVDTLVVDYQGGTGGWTETSRSFNIDRAGYSSSSFHQEDDGVGVSDESGGGVTVVRTHTLDVSSSSAFSDILWGTAQSYAFDRERKDEANRKEVRTSDFSNPQRGEYRSTHNTTWVSLVSWNNPKGTFANGETHLIRIDEGKNFANGTESHSWRCAPAGLLKYREQWNDQIRWSRLQEYREGNDQVGKGEFRLTGRNGSWSRTGERDGLPPRVDEWTGLLGAGTSWVVPVADGSDGLLPPLVNNRSWGQIDQSAGATTWDEFWAGLGRSARDEWEEFKDSWLYKNGADVARVAVGLFDVGLGMVVTLMSGGAGVVPGVALITVGLDQYLTGVSNIAARNRDEAPLPSVIEFRATSAARSLGFSEEAAHLIGAFTPAVLSVGLGAWGITLASNARAARILAREIAIATDSARGGTVSSAALRLEAHEWAQGQVLLYSNPGRALSKSEIESFERFLQRNYGAKLVRNDPALPQSVRLRPNEAARFDVTASGEMVILYREGAQGYTLLHEYIHLLHYRKVGSFEAWARLSASALEQVVYDELKLRFWKLLTDEQRRNAAFQVFSRNGFAW